ncbi:cytochrome P450 4C1-like [Euwallacea fornicatus]|uniref:cytochrome P450 4C1-like n=1 Tax=Euwallacea fornicatus TaxID=995702 RepID=UPI00338F1603
MISTMILNAFGALFAIILITILVKRWLLLRNVENKVASWMPTVPRVPILGSVFEMGNPAENLKDLQRFTDNPCKSSYVEILGTSNIVTKNSEILEFVLSSNKILTKSHDYDFLLPWLGEGLLISKGAKWKSHRKAITPTFHFSILEVFVDVFNSNVDTMIQKLKKMELGKNSFDVYQYVTACTLDIICESAMGVNLQSQENSMGDEYVHAVKNITRIAQDRWITAWKSFDFLFNLTSDSKILAESLKIAHKFTNSVIERKTREMMKGEAKQEKTEDVLGKKSRKAFLDLLLNSTIDGRRLTQEELRQEVDTFMFAGHDTTSSGISSAFHVLANRPDIQKQLREELKGVFESKNARITYQDLQGLKYLEMVIKETLRLYPPAPVISRVVEEDAEFKGHTIPKGTVIVMSIYNMHRDPDYYENAENFDPERFMETATKNSAYTYIPFSAGPRNCIGQKFAILEMKTFISKMVMNFEILPANPPREMELISETILKSRNGVHIRLKECQ